MKDHYHKFKVKFDAQCKICGCDIDEDSEVRGKKDRHADNWTIICPSCHDKLPQDSTSAKDNVQDAAQAEDQASTDSQALKDIKAQAKWRI